MELPSKLLEQITFNTRLKTKKQMSVVIDNSTDEGKLFQLLETNNKHFKTAINFLSGYVCILQGKTTNQ